MKGPDALKDERLGGRSALPCSGTGVASNG